MYKGEETEDKKNMCQVWKQSKARMEERHEMKLSLQRDDRSHRTLWVTTRLCNSFHNNGTQLKEFKQWVKLSVLFSEEIFGNMCSVWKSWMKKQFIFYRVKKKKENGLCWSSVQFIELYYFKSDHWSQTENFSYSVFKCNLQVII